MSYSVSFYPSADRDMDSIEEYLSRFYSSTVYKFFLKLEEKVSALEDMPYMYPAYERDPYFRCMPINEYLLFYHVDEGCKQVKVHRVLHGKTDIAKQIQEYRKGG
ncbi:MAG: type II toxin-antitoxin system RelE/ParE family toxin [Clostridiales bacterium]|nr:type II toxin-antitoxin system RelE/ParE family toxin [Clostridiales bacterium]